MTGDVGGMVHVLRHVSSECEVIHVSGDIVRDNRELDDEKCPLYRAIMVLRVQLEAENWNYILEFMDHTKDREEGDADHRGRSSMVLRPE